MIPLFEKFSNLLNRREQDRPRHQGRRLGVESLEDRCVMTATATGVVSGVAFVDFNSNLIHDAQEVVAPGIQATLTGKTTLGSAVSVSATTDSNGAYSFLNVQPGTYHLNYSPTSGLPGSLVSSFSVKGGQTVTRDIATPGVPLELVSLNQYLSDSTLASGVFQPAGGGDGLASSRANNAPTLLASAVLSVSGVKNGSNVIDLAGTFTDPDITNSHVSFKTSAGSIDVQLFDKLAPKTVANFLNYVVSNRYDDAIFHRLGAFLHGSLTTRDVLQGGLFKFDSSNNQGNLTTITEAWARRRVLRLTYRSAGKRRPKEVIVEPYFLEPSAAGFATYLIGYSRTHGQMRTFKIERVVSAHKEPESFTLAAELDVDTLLSSAWGVIWGEGTAVKLRFKPDVAWRVKESRWHPSQQIEELPGGGCLLTISVASIMELGRWVRGWGDRVEVLEPAELRAELRDEAVRLARQYSAQPKKLPRPHASRPAKHARTAGGALPLSADPARE